MYTSISFRPGSEEALALEYIRKINNLRPETEPLEHPEYLEEANILALHYADSGAQGDPGAVEILYRTPRGVKVLYGNYAYGNLNLDAVIRKLPMLKSLDSRRAMTPPYPFGGNLHVPEGWGYLYLGALNHFYARDEVCSHTETFLKTFLSNSDRRWQVFEAIAWYCGAEP